MPHTLLLADDSVTIQRVIELTFADEDVRVVAVSNGDDAIAFVDRTPPDIVLADVGMPGRNGYEVAQYIKQTPRLAHIPVLLLTGAFEPVDQAQVAAVGSDGVLAKPFEPQLVIGRVRELLANRSPQAGAAPPAPPPQPAGASNDYFDRLDQAFASLGAAKSAESSINPPAPSRNVPDLPLSHGASPLDFDRLADLGISSYPPAPVAPPQAAAPTPVPPPAPPAAPVPEITQEIVDRVARRALDQLPPPPAPPAAPAPEITQEVVDRVARRVLDQLSDRVVRETVTGKVSEVAERLVRQEIERIKASIK